MQTLACWFLYVDMNVTRKETDKLREEHALSAAVLGQEEKQEDGDAEGGEEGQRQMNAEGGQEEQQEYGNAEGGEAEQRQMDADGGEEEHARSEGGEEEQQAEDGEEEEPPGLLPAGRLRRRRWRSYAEQEQAEGSEEEGQDIDCPLQRWKTRTAGWRSWRRAAL